MEVRNRNGQVADSLDGKKIEPPHMMSLIILIVMSISVLGTCCILMLASSDVIAICITVIEVAFLLFVGTQFVSEKKIDVLKSFFENTSKVFKKSEERQ